MHATSIRLATMLSIGISSLAVSACAHMDNGLDGTQWQLTAWSLSSQRATDTIITAQFADGRISGSTGVNRYAGPYQATASGSFSVQATEVTEMAGPEPAMRAERAYLKLLGQAASYKKSDGRLTLHGTGVNELLIFEPRAR